MVGFVMIEKIVIDYLTQALTVPVYSEVPEKPPASFMLVEKVGSSGSRYLPQAAMAVQSYAKTHAQTAALNCAVKRAMLSDDFLRLTDIVNCTCTSDYNFTDTQTKRYRYQALFLIRYYE